MLMVLLDFKVTNGDRLIAPGSNVATEDCNLVLITSNGQVITAPNVPAIL